MLRSLEVRHTAPALVAAAVVLSACAGSNLFQVAVPLGGGGPSVVITSPTQGVTVAAGASLSVAAEAEAPDGIASATISGVFQDGSGAAFTQQTISYANVPATTINRTLGATPGAATGPVWVIVSVTDAGGVTAADTVSITVN